MKTYDNLGPRSSRTPQSEPIPGSEQRENNASGFSFVVDDMTRLLRFLILGSQGGTYYVKARELTKQNLDVVERLLAAKRGQEIVESIVAVSEQGRAVSNDPALFALACCTVADDLAVRRAALAMLPRVARTGTHLLHFVRYTKQFRGWGRAYKRSIAEWYQSKSVAKLAYQVVKYQQRDGYAQRDLLRLAHPKTDDVDRNALYKWIVDDIGPEFSVIHTSEPNNADTGTRGNGLDSLEIQNAPTPEHPLALLWAFESAKRMETDEEVARLVKRYRLPREAVPTTRLNASLVWEALLEDMPLEAMTRNLATMTRVGLLKPMSAATQAVVERLRSQEAIRKARLHPIKLLAALKTYQNGKSERGTNTWTPVPAIIDALNDAFYLAFKNVEPTNKRLVLALDVSGSMGMSSINALPSLTAREGSAAMALVTAAAERDYSIMAFGHEFVPVDISPRQRLDDVIQRISGLPFGATDCALPMTWAMKQHVKADAFIIYTDSETWANPLMHPVQALREYRKMFGIPAKLIVVSMVGTEFSIADPDDGGMLDVVGFDTNTPQVIAEFLRGAE